jgi:tetratricopeptide (TPR) repeat protein
MVQQFRDVILNQVPNYGSKLRNDLLRGIPRVWTNYFMLDKDKDVAFEVGRFYYGTREYAKALEFYRISSESIGEHHVTAHNMGLCYYSMSKFPESLEYFSKSLDLNKDYEKARSWRSKVEKELAGKEIPAPPPVTKVDIGGDTESSDDDDE